MNNMRFPDDVLPACKATCAPTKTVIQACEKNVTSPGCEGGCQRDWLNTYFICINCINANTEALDLRTFESTSAWAKTLDNTCRAWNGVSASVSLLDWSQLNNTVGSNTTASGTSSPELTGTSTTAAQGESKEEHLGHLIGGILGGTAAIILGAGLILWLIRRQRVRSPVHQERFEIDAADMVERGGEAAPRISPFTVRRQTSAEQAPPPPLQLQPLSPVSSTTPVIPHTQSSSESSEEQLPAYKRAVLRALRVAIPAEGQAQDAGRIARSPPGPPEVPPRYDPAWAEERSDDGRYWRSA